MNILIREATVWAPGSAWDGKKTDILIEGGTISQIKKSITPKGNVKIIEEEGLMVSPGWVDLQAVSCDPGFEHKETLESMISCAAAGGFTTVCVHNYNQPATHNKAQVEYIVNKTRNKVVDVLPFGTITHEGKGKDLAEMYDMKQSGAVAFSDHKQTLRDAGSVMRALQYAANVDAFIVTHCHDSSVAQGGQMNEGEVSTTLGLKGIPALAEELMLERNISVLEYAGGRLHIPTISTKGSVDIIRKAKAAGLPVTCGVAAVNLLVDDSALRDFNTNFKLDPPLRTKRDVQALRNAVESGVIDVIVSDHMPHDPECKELEFDHADPGMINLQTAFSCALEGMKEKGLGAILRCLTVSPREILGLEQPRVEEGQPANLTIFSTSGKTTLTDKTNHSLSSNSPFIGQEMQGRVVGVINESRSYFN